MSLPSGLIDELRDRLKLSDVAGRKVSWDRRRSNPAKGDFWAPCPFHQEKTPSFHVEDTKGFYYCFGCQAKGDLITFVKETENLSFIEAVERLAAEAGMEMPRQQDDPGRAARRDRLSRLATVMEEAVRVFALSLRGHAGQGARAYAARRGLTEDLLKRFEIGYAPEGRHALTRHFEAKGQIEDAVAAGLVIRDEQDGAPFDRFRDRLIFPIRDARGRCIAFGGRALSPKARAKYLNSPDTELFHKGRTLYNHHPAREAAGKTGRLIVAEGYMDVIALARAGFDHAVAPLGTAITEEQLELLWRMAPEPVIALDGDESGLRAAHRLIDLALPRLGPGRSLQFCLLPEGQDPDELIRAGGPRAMQAALEAAVPLVEMLWRREVSVDTLETPERRAAFDARLRTILGQIADRSIRQHYEADLRQRRAALFRPAAKQTERGRAAHNFGRRWTPPAAGPAAMTKSSWLARGGPGRGARRGREAAILLAALNNHEALGPIESELEEIPLEDATFAAIRDGLLQALAEDLPPGPLIAERIGEDPTALLARHPQARALPQARPGQPPERLRAVLSDAIARHETQLALEAELAEASRDFAEAEGEDWTWRIRQARHERLQVDARALEDFEAEEANHPSELNQLIEKHLGAGKKPKLPSSNQ